MSMTKFNVEESNLISIYINNSNNKQELIRNITTVLPFLVEDMKELATCTIDKIAKLSEEENEKLTIHAQMIN